MSTLDTRDRRALQRLVPWVGVIGSVLLALYFGIPAFIPRLSGLLYASGTPSTSRVVAVGADYHVLLGFGSWIQGVGALLCVLFFLGVVELAGGADTLAGRIVLLGSAVLLAVVAAEMLFTFTWAHSSAVNQPDSARSAFDLMTHFIQVFPILPAPIVYLALAFVLYRGQPVLPPVFARLALYIGAAFCLVGLIGALASSAGAGAAGLSALQDLWILAAAVVMMRRSARRAVPA